MQRAISTLCFASQRLTVSWLERIQEADIPLVELYCSRRHLDYRDTTQAADLAHWFRDSRLKIHSLHSPIHNDESGGRSGPQSRINITEPVKSKRIAIVDEIKRALDLIEFFPFRYFIQHIGIPDEDYDEQKLDSAFTALEQIVLFAKQRGVEVLLENLPSGMACAERLLLFNNITHMNLNFCFDSGHANLMEGVGNSFDLMKPRIRSVSLHDNDGKDDLHLYPQAGTIHWRRLMTKLRTLEPAVPLLLEVKERAGVARPLDELRRAFDALEAMPSPHPEEEEGEMA
jgi:sugar phosphate isomerase/epimerase